MNEQGGAVELAERVLNVLDQGRFTTTYKYAVLLGIMDLCLENTARSGAPPEMLTTRQLAEKVFELYWPQVTPYRQTDPLRQTRGRSDQRASVLALVTRFRDVAASRIGKALPLLDRARSACPDAFEEAIREAEWTLIRYPVLLLQRVGGVQERFLYDIGWDEGVRRGDVRRYQAGKPSDFDNRLMLRPHVGEHLVRLNNLLRPLIQRQWTAEVARINSLEEAELQTFLFGAERVSLAAVRQPLLELQEGRCFYCDRPVGTAEVDHFLPWSRYPGNGIENLVVADRACNGNKRDFLAAARHVEAWSARLIQTGSLWRDLREIAQSVGWSENVPRTASVARAIYLRLPDAVRLWEGRDEFSPVDRDSIRVALARVA